MITGDTSVSRLGAGGDGLAVSCSAEGLFLGRTALIERRGDHYVLRPPAELERLLGRAYGGQIIIERLMPGFAAIAGALDINKLGLAQIAAANLGLSDLPDMAARIGVEVENLLIKLDRIDGQLARIV